MPRQVFNKLTPLAIKNAKPGRHADGAGLYLLVKASGAKSWLYRATVAGKVRDVGLGSAGPAGLNLAKARELARAKAAEAASGAIPVSERTKRATVARAALAERAKAKTFKEVAEAYIDLKESGWRNDKHKAQWRSTLAAYAYPQFGDLPVGDVTTEHVLEVLRPIWNTKPETASRLRGRIENIMDAARVQGLCSGENPARWRGHLNFVLAKQSKLTRGHHAALAYAAMPAFMADLAGRDALAARALEFTIFNVARSGEALGATWAEIDLEAKIWTIPAARMKAGKEHRVPLSSRALAILKAVQPLNTTGSADARLFPGRSKGGLSIMAMTMLLRRMGRDEITVHGFRSTFREWAGEATSYAREVVEHALAHQLADKAEAAYQRGTLFPKRVKLMQAWADYCASPVADGSNVSPIRAEG